MRVVRVKGIVRVKDTHTIGRPRDASMILRSLRRLVSLGGCPGVRSVTCLVLK